MTRALRGAGPGSKNISPSRASGIQRTKLRVDAVAPRLAVDDAAERSFRQARHPGGAAAEPRQQAGDIELAAADPDLERRAWSSRCMPGGDSRSSVSPSVRKS